jgi:hypothetical protein
MKNVFLGLMMCCSFLSWAQENTSSWFVFQPGENSSSSRVNMTKWLDAPAGKHGFLQINKDDLQFSNGTPVKFWGVNIASNKPFVPAAEAIKWSEFIASYGINAVRFHKFTWGATDGVHSTQLTDDKWKNFDFFNQQLRNRGIYYSWSHIYGHRVLPGDSSRLIAYKEVAGTKFPWSHINGSTASIVNFAEDLQALNIELTVNMLNHKNTYTGLRYADDPALAYIELQNEDNIFWGAIEETLNQTPSYRALLCKKFSQWLQNKYGAQTALEAAWGSDNLAAGESLDQQNIYPRPNHGYFSGESERAWKANSSLPKHVADKAAFLAEEQIAYYKKFTEAIRSTGYKGVIVSSCWQAGTGIAHLWNVYTDAEIGPVDRHNYSGGGTGHTLKPGKVDNTPMVAVPGSGLLSTGFQQVASRPFFISEWMSLIPNEWTAESSPIVAAYGMGLQGWDASFAFAMDYDHFTPTIQSGHGVYNITSPTQLALYPALAAMIYRKDVKQGEIIATRHVSIDKLRKGELPFFERIEQESDVKRLLATVPLASLAAGRVLLSFEETNKPVENNSGNLIDTVNKVVHSSTNQLHWNYAKKGYFTINTGGTQGIVGFAGPGAVPLKDVTIKLMNDFAVVLASSLDKNKGIASSKNLLITTIARARNTGMKYDQNKNNLIEVGTAPILLEPVYVQLNVKTKKTPTIYVLDHSGHRTGKTVPVKNGSAILNGEIYKTIYYEVVYP